MRSVILAAGAATRLRPISDTIPKCLLQVGGQPLLQRSIEALFSNGIHQIIIVVGYRSESVITFCNTTYSSETLRCIVNPDYASTNNAYSLLLTEEHILGHDMMLLDGDILFDPRLIGHLLSSRQPNALLLRPSHLLGSEEIKVVTGTDNRVLRISKDINPGDAAGESIGIERFSEPTVRNLFKILRRRIGGEQRVNEWYEASFQELIDNGARIFAVDTAGLPCIEIDTTADIETAERDVLPVLGV
jgi:choline kinase